jgi:hypothetical protein
MFKRENELVFKLDFILVGPITECLREFLEARIVESQPAISDFLLSNQSKFNEPHLKEAKSKIKKYKKDHSGNLPNSLDIFDITSLVAMSQNLFPSINSSAAWQNKEISFKNSSIEGCLQNVRLIRNKYIGHLAAYEIAEDKYHDLVKYLRKVIQILLNSNLKKCQYLNKLIDSIESLEIMSNMNERLEQISKKIDNTLYFIGLSSLLVIVSSVLSRFIGSI